MPEEKDISEKITDKLPDRDEDFDYGDTLPDGQHENHPVLEDTDKLERPLRFYYKHLRCSVITRMPTKVAQTVAANPKFYDRMFCAGCGKYFPCGPEGEFVWKDTESKVGT